MRHVDLYPVRWGFHTCQTAVLGAYTTGYRTLKYTKSFCILFSTPEIHLFNTNVASWNLKDINYRTTVLSVINYFILVS